MAHRTFTDASGVRWDVWDVTPRSAERRSRRDRRDTPIHEAEDPPVLEDRAGRERRRSAPDARLSVPISEPLRRGWLAFESRSERRRLAPVPERWAELPEQELEALCRTATPVAVTRGRLIE